MFCSPRAPPPPPRPSESHTHRNNPPTPPTKVPSRPFTPSAPHRPGAQTGPDRFKPPRLPWFQQRHTRRTRAEDGRRRALNRGRPLRHETALIPQRSPVSIRISGPLLLRHRSLQRARLSEPANIDIYQTELITTRIDTLQTEHIGTHSYWHATDRIHRSSFILTRDRQSTLELIHIDTRQTGHIGTPSH